MVTVITKQQKLEFYRFCKARLNEDGIIDGHIGLCNVAASYFDFWSKDQCSDALPEIKKKMEQTGRSLFLKPSDRIALIDEQIKLLEP